MGAFDNSPIMGRKDYTAPLVIKEGNQSRLNLGPFLKTGLKNMLGMTGAAPAAAGPLSPGVAQATSAVPTTAPWAYDASKVDAGRAPLSSAPPAVYSPPAPKMPVPSSVSGIYTDDNTDMSGTPNITQASNPSAMSDFNPDGSERTKPGYWNAVGEFKQGVNPNQSAGPLTFEQFRAQRGGDALPVDIAGHMYDKYLPGALNAAKLPSEIGSMGAQANMHQAIAENKVAMTPFEQAHIGAQVTGALATGRHADEQSNQLRTMSPLLQGEAVAKSEFYKNRGRAALENATKTKVNELPEQGYANKMGLLERYYKLLPLMTGDAKAGIQAKINEIEGKDVNLFAKHAQGPLTINNTREDTLE